MYLKSLLRSAMSGAASGKKAQNEKKNMDVSVSACVESEELARA